MRFQALMPDVSFLYERLLVRLLSYATRSCTGLELLRLIVCLACQSGSTSSFWFQGELVKLTSNDLFSMKHDAIVEQGIPIHERVPIPDELIPEDSRVEIDAKIHAGYCKMNINRNQGILYRVLNVIQSPLAESWIWQSYLRYKDGLGTI